MSRNIYLDYAATTLVDPRIFAAMRPYFGERFGNPGSLHAYGQEAQAALDSAREKIASLLRLPAPAGFREIIFAGSATEANNLALRGAWRGRRDGKMRRLIVSAVEHESVLATARDLEREGAEVKILPVDKAGRVDLKKLRASLNEETFLVSVIFAQNEVGTIEPVPEIGAMIRDFRRGETYPLFHSDAAQAFQFLDCSPEALRADMLTLSAHKIYGPKGAGILYRKAGAPLAPILTGGGQEFGLRSGTESVPLIVGLARALELAAAERGAAGDRLSKLQKELWVGIKRAAPLARLNGPAFGKNRLPNNINVHLPGLPADKSLTALDLAGIAASSGSACASRSAAPSHTLLAMGLGAKRAGESVRFSLGRPTSAAEIRAAGAILRRALRGI